MLKHLFAAALAATLIAAPATITSAQQTSTEKSDKAEKTKPAKKETAAKELSPQQKKMKDCAGKWGDYKKEKNVKGRAEYNKFMSGCLKA